ncbi:MAG: diaminopimelate epimerase [Hyphomonadaceae bacterium]|nr:MAG: diaminopimelate epimerase [Caulobacteraceae bacterium]MBT9447698.1 diaminopimelate epimerase [Hyphomonadaceae bacterium]TPW02643.1 MAG: diaminopimelate epimerase [Alphaproteobacteria bacterium]
MRFFKMNGCGNDFVIFDARAHGALQLSKDQARAIADREEGVGCDQVIAIERSIRGDAFMRIWNADGGEVTACGNASRCVASILLDERGDDGPVKIETLAGVLKAERTTLGQITVDMGSPLLKWEEIPIARAMDTERLDYEVDAGLFHLGHPGACNMGNPHAVFFVNDVKLAPVAVIGPRVETDPFFPDGVNVGFAQILSPERIKLRVWERGVGETKACGTGACAAVVAAHRAGLTSRTVTVELEGGDLVIEWKASDDRVLMTGPVELERVGDLLGAA